MKIFFSVSDCGCAAHVGGSVNQEAFVIEIEDSLVPQRLKKAISHSTDPKSYVSVSCFVLKEEPK